MPVTLASLRRFAVTRSLATPTSLERAIERLGFVQADPIRAPARAQDLTLRQRVKGYRAGDLERLYPTLAIEEDTFINYGFVTRAVFELMHPRSGIGAWTSAQKRRTQDVLAFVRERGAVHPKDVDREFSHGSVTNYWGGSSNATTHLLDLMHYRGLLRVAGRQDGIRTYAAREPLARSPSAADGPERAERTRAGSDRVDRLVDVLVRKYAPLSARSLAIVVRRLRYAAPQWHADLDGALARARARLSRGRVGDLDWFWPTEESFDTVSVPEGVRLLTPFDPVVWDRNRFEQLWGWEYRFEAYTPVAKRVRGYYALPLLWRDRVIGWANAAVKEGVLQIAAGYVSAGPPRDRGFQSALEEEIERLRMFLNLPGADTRRHRA